MGCDKRTLLVDGTRSNFNPRTHVGCDPGAPEPPEPPGLISIHAPTWGATVEPGLNGGFWVISIHAPTWGATILRVSRESGKLFQSTHPRGVRHQARGFWRKSKTFQSTHPRGVRHRSTTPTPPDGNFNPRTHVGCDIFSISPESLPFEFQSTHPRGVRPEIERAWAAH